MHLQLLGCCTLYICCSHALALYNVSRVILQPCEPARYTVTPSLNGTAWPRVPYTAKTPQYPYQVLEFYSYGMIAGDAIKNFILLALRTMIVGIDEGFRPYQRVDKIISNDQAGGRVSVALAPANEALQPRARKASAALELVVTPMQLYEARDVACEIHLHEKLAGHIRVKLALLLAGEVGKLNNTSSSS